MTEQDKINNDLQTKLVIHDEKFDRVMEKLDDFRREMQDFKNEMRQQNEMRTNEMAEIRKSVQSIQDSGRNQTIVTFLGIAAMVIAVLLK